jgi:hypothetical protein
MGDHSETLAMNTPLDQPAIDNSLTFTDIQIAEILPGEKSESIKVKEQFRRSHLANTSNKYHNKTLAI